MEEAIQRAEETLELSKLENISLGFICAECMDPFPESKLTSCEVCGSKYCADCNDMDDSGVCATCNDEMGVEGYEG